MHLQRVLVPIFGAIPSKFEWVMYDIEKIVHNLLSRLLDKPLKLWP